MNYYPNYYMNNYPYGNNSNQYMPQQAQSYMPINQAQPQLNGKVVDSIDVVRATEVPIGGYGIFPKADLSEVYIKSWNNNGTTSIITFNPVPQPEQSEAPQDNTITEILNKVNSLEVKIDNLFLAKANENNVKKETKTNGYQPTSSANAK